MKMLPEHYAILRDAIDALPKDAVKAHRESLHNDTRVKNLSMRLRWDLLHAARVNTWLCDTLYPYLNDTHIDTALRSIIDKLNLGDNNA